MIPKLYTIKEVAETLRMSEKTLRRMMTSGKIEFYKNPGMTGKILFSEKHITDYLEKQCSI